MNNDEILSVMNDMVMDGSICKKCGYYFAKAHGHPCCCNTCDLELKRFTGKLDRIFGCICNTLNDCKEKERDEYDIKSSIYIALHNALKKEVSDE